MDDALQQFQFRRAFKWPPSFEQLMQQDAEGEDVAARVRGFARGLFRRHVGDGSENNPRVSAFSKALGGGLRIGTLLKFGQAEIGQLCISVSADQDILRLDIAVQDSGRVSGGKTVSDAREEFYDLPPAGFFRTNPVAECAAVHELSYQILMAFKIAGVVNGNDVWMIKRGSRLRLALKPAAGSRVGYIAEEKLDGDWAVQLGVESAVHDAHTALSNDCIDAIGTELGAYVDIWAAGIWC
jgi:hypothetical protein